MLNRFTRGCVTSTPAFTTVVDISPEIILDGAATDLALTLTNTSANALTSFIMAVKTDKDDTFSTLLSGTDWAGLANHGYLVPKQGTLHTLAGGATGRVHIKIGPWYSVKFTATATTAATTTLRVNIAGVK